MKYISSLSYLFIDSFYQMVENSGKHKAGFAAVFQLS